MNWYVLFVLSQYEDSFCEYLKKCPEIEAFSAKMEYYRKDRDRIEIKSAFPGYIFVLSKKNQREFNEWLQKLELKKGLIKQLKYKEAQALRPEEIKILEQFLDEEHIFRMSYGYLKEKRLVIEEGPLKGFDDYITKYDKRHRLAGLDLYFLDQRWTAGVTLKEFDS